MSSLEAIWRHDGGLLIVGRVKHLGSVMFIGDGRQHDARRSLRSMELQDLLQLEGNVPIKG
jgi:hypothetical protein